MINKNDWRSPITHMLGFDLLSNLHQMLLVYMLDLHQAFHNLKYRIINQRIG